MERSLNFFILIGNAIIAGQKILEFLFTETNKLIFGGKTSFLINVLAVFKQSKTLTYGLGKLATLLALKLEKFNKLKNQISEQRDQTRQKTELLDYQFNMTESQHNLFAM